MHTNIGSFEPSTTTPEVYAKALALNPMGSPKPREVSVEAEVSCSSITKNTKEVQRRSVGECRSCLRAEGARYKDADYGIEHRERQALKELAGGARDALEKSEGAARSGRSHWRKGSGG